MGREALPPEINETVSKTQHRGVYGTGNITVNIFEKRQSTTTYYLKKKKKKKNLISLLELENIYDAYHQPKV